MSWKSTDALRSTIVHYREAFFRFCALRSTIVQYREAFFRFCDDHPHFIAFQLLLLTIGAALLLREDTKQRNAARQRLADAPPAKPKMAFQVSKDLKLDPPKSDPISPEELAECDGSRPGKPIWVAIKGLWDQSLGRELTAAQARSSTSARRGICTGRAAATMCVALLADFADCQGLRGQRLVALSSLSADCAQTARGDSASRR